MKHLKRLNEHLTEAKVSYNFSEEELKRVLKLLGRSASTEVKMIKAFEKALGRKLTRDELFESVVTEDHGGESRMAKSDLFKIANYGQEIHDMLTDEMNLPEWVESKITKSADYLGSVKHYLEYEMEAGETFEKRTSGPFDAKKVIKILKKNPDAMFFLGHGKSMNYAEPVKDIPRDAESGFFSDEDGEEYEFDFADIEFVDESVVAESMSPKVASEKLFNELTSGRAIKSYSKSKALNIIDKFLSKWVIGEGKLTEAEDYKYKKYVKKAFDKIQDEMFAFRNAMGVKQSAQADSKIKKILEELHKKLIYLKETMKNKGLTEGKLNESVIGITTDKSFKPADLQKALDKAKVKYKMNRLSMTLSVLNLDKKYYDDAKQVVDDLGLTVMMAKESAINEAEKGSEERENREKLKKYAEKISKAGEAADKARDNAKKAEDKKDPEAEAVARIQLQKANAQAVIAKSDARLFKHKLQKEKKKNEGKVTESFNDFLNNRK